MAENNPLIEVRSSTRSTLGYWGKMTQPGKRLNIKLTALPEIDFGRLDDWLRAAFAIEVAPLDVPAEVYMSSDRVGDAAMLTWRICHLAREIFWRMKFPSFDAVHMQYVRARDEGREIHVGVIAPYYPVISDALFTNCYAEAGRALIDFVLKRPSIDLELLSDRFEAELINPAERAVSGGASTVTLLMAAHACGIPFRQATGRVYQCGQGSAARWVDRTGIDRDSAIGARLAQNKAHAATIMRAAGLPVPRHMLARDEDAAVAAASGLGYPVVVKPVDRDASTGVTVDVADEQAIRAAFRTAREASSQVLVEEQIAGTCHRIFVADGKVIYASARWPLHVIGDGRSTVRALVAEFTRQQLAKIRYLRFKPMPEEEEATAILASAGLRLDDVPPPGQRVNLRPAESVAWGGRSEVVTERMHPENAKLAVRAAQQMRLEVAGIDLMTTDIALPWQESGARINEINPYPLLGVRLPQNRAAAAELIRGAFPAGGRIPVILLVGDEEAWNEGLRRQERDVAAGILSFVCSQDGYRGPDGPAWNPGPAGLLSWTTQLLTRKDVEKIYLVMQDDAALQVGFPVDRVDQAFIINEAIRSSDHPENGIDAERFRRLLKLIEMRSRSSPQRAAI